MEDVLEIVGEDLEKEVYIRIKTLRTKNRGEFKVVFNKESQKFNVGIEGGKKLHLTYIEMRNLLDVLHGWLGDIEEKFVEEAQQYKLPPEE